MKISPSSVGTTKTTRVELSTEHMVCLWMCMHVIIKCWPVLYGVRHHLSPSPGLCMCGAVNTWRQERVCQNRVLRHVLLSICLTINHTSSIVSPTDLGDRPGQDHEPARFRTIKIKWFQWVYLAGIHAFPIRIYVWLTRPQSPSFQVITSINWRVFAFCEEEIKEL